VPGSPVGACRTNSPSTGSRRHSATAATPSSRLNQSEPDVHRATAPWQPRGVVIVGPSLLSSAYVLNLRQFHSGSIPISGSPAIGSDEREADNLGEEGDPGGRHGVLKGPATARSLRVPIPRWSPTLTRSSTCRQSSGSRQDASYSTSDSPARVSLRTRTAAWPFSVVTPAGAPTTVPLSGAVDAHRTFRRWPPTTS
jgi:hypothetical protein